MTICVSTCAEIDETEREEHGEDVQQPVLLPPVPGGEVEYGPRDDAEAEAVGDGVGKRNEDECEKRGDRDERLVPADFRDGGEHHRANKDERGGGSGWGDDTDEGGCGDSDEKQQAGDDGGDARATASRDTGSGLNVA